MTEEQRREQVKELAWRVAVASGVEYDKALAAVMSLANPSDGRRDLLRDVRRGDASDVAERQREEANEHDGTA